MKFVLLSPSNSENKWVMTGIEEYSQKISHFVKIEIPEKTGSKISRENSLEKKNQESETILKNLVSEDYVVLLDEKGKNLNSLEWSVAVNKIMSSGKKRCVFIVGGAYGVSEEVKNRANLTVSFGSAVMNHHLIKLVLLEQIYRSFTILKNIPYHNK